VVTGDPIKGLSLLVYSIIIKIKLVRPIVGIRFSDMKSALKSIIPKTKLHHFRHLKQSVKGMVGFYVRDLKNLLRYGPDCPRAFQLVFLSPEEITSTLIPKRFSEDDAGKVLPGDWDKKVKNLNEVKKWVTIYDALRAGLRWEDSRMFELYSNSKKYSPNALKRRYEDLVGVVEKIHHDGYLKQRRELSPFNFRERGGDYGAYWVAREPGVCRRWIPPSSARKDLPISTNSRRCRSCTRGRSDRGEFHGSP